MKIFFTCIASVRKVLGNRKGKDVNIKGRTKNEPGATSIATKGMNRVKSDPFLINNLINVCTWFFFFSSIFYLLFFFSFLFFFLFSFLFFSFDLYVIYLFKCNSSLLVRVWFPLNKICIDWPESTKICLTPSLFF